MFEYLRAGLHGLWLKQVAHLQRSRQQPTAELNTFPLHRLDLIREPSDTEATNPPSGIVGAHHQRRFDIIL